MNLLNTLLPVFMLFVCLAAPFTQSAPAKFIGVIVGPDERRIPKVKVLIENGNRKWKIKSDKNGEFNVELPAGEYKFTLNTPKGFKNLIVTNVRIRQGITILYNFKTEFGECSHCDSVLMMSNKY